MTKSPSVYVMMPIEEKRLIERAAGLQNQQPGGWARTILLREAKTVLAQEEAGTLEKSDRSARVFGKKVEP